MQPRSPKLLEDIRDAAAFIREATRSSEAEKFRNVLSHGYDIVDPAIVWSAVQDDLHC